MAPSTPPAPDYDAASKTASGTTSTINSLLQGMGLDAWTSTKIAGLAGGTIFGVSFIVLEVMKAVIAVGSWLAEQFLTLLDTAKEDNKDQLRDLLATTVNELLGTSITGDQLSGGSGAGSSWDANQAIGGALIGLLETAFQATGPVSPDQGQANAQKFAGFGVNFAATQGFISILAEACSAGFLKEFHELPDGLMRALGLSRLQRQALQPLIRNAVQQPYDLKLRSIFRPDRLSTPQLIAALHMGNMQEADVRQGLAEQGYPDAVIEILIADTTPPLSVGEAQTLINNGDLTEKDALDNLTLDGTAEATVQLRLTAAKESLAAGQVSSYLSDLDSAYVSGLVDEDTWNSIIKSLPLGDAQEQMYRNRVGFKKERARTWVSFAELTAAIVHGTVDFGYVDTWLAAHGYDDQGQLILNYQILQALTDAANKEKYKEYRAQVLKDAGKTVPPWLQ